MTSATPTRILGLDPGLARLGFGLLERIESEWRMADCGMITTPAGAEPAHRLEELSDKLEQLVAELKPDVVATEQLFFSTNVKTAMAVAEARGVILLTLARAKLPISEYTGLQVKQSVTGYGQADKKQVADMVCRLLKLTETPKPDDVTDALAIALCHAGWRKG